MIIIIIIIIVSQVSSVGIATGYWLDGRVRFPAVQDFFFSQQRPDRLWGSPIVLSNGYHGLFPRE
jgi:hypothetical protein